MKLFAPAMIGLSLMIGSAMAAQAPAASMSKTDTSAKPVTKVKKHKKHVVAATPATPAVAATPVKPVK